MKNLPGNQFDIGLLGHHCWLELANGDRVELPVERWTAGRCDGDEQLLGPCTGPTVDLGCGPGRLTAALTARGIVALGVDSSSTAVRLTRARGAHAVRRDVFDQLPAEGRWAHALLADGNIGIGGDPVALLRRVSRLLAPGGSTIVELDPPGSGLRYERVRIRSHTPRPQGGPFTWAWVGADAATELADEAGLRVAWTAHQGQRWFTELVRT
jgi:SAM-dependent methyltransferase